MDDNALEARLKSLEERLARLESGKPAKPVYFAPGSSVPVAAAKTPSKPVDWESLAGTWFNRVGIVALVFGVSFFLKYAFDHRWIGELGRVVLGILAGMAMLAAGDRFARTGMAYYGRMLLGGGICVLYLSGYSAFAYYHLITQTAAFSFLVAVTASACALAVRQDARPIATLGLLGGFLTPKLLSTGSVQEHALFGYLLVLNLGLMAVARFKDWRELGLLALALTELYVQGYRHSHHYSPEKLWMFLGYASAYWAVFALSAAARRGAGPRSSEDSTLAVLNAGVFYWTLYHALKAEHRAWLGPLAVAVAAAYAGLASALESAKAERSLVLAHLGVAVALLVAAVPIHFELKWVTIGWAAEAAALLAAGFKLDHKPFRLMGAAVLAAAAARALLSDSHLRGDYIFLLNQRTLSYAAVLAAILVLARGYALLGTRAGDEELAFRNAFGVAGIFLGFCWISYEARGFWDVLDPARRAAWLGGDLYRNLRIAKSFSLSAAWALYGSGWFLYGVFIERKPVRLLALGILTLTVLKVFLVDLSFLRAAWRILSLMGLGAVAMAVSYYYQRGKTSAAAA